MGHVKNNEASRNSASKGHLLVTVVFYSVEYVQEKGAI